MHAATVLLARRSYRDKQCLSFGTEDHPELEMGERAYTLNVQCPRFDPQLYRECIPPTVLVNGARRGADLIQETDLLSGHVAYGHGLLSELLFPRWYRRDIRV